MAQGQSIMLRTDALRKNFGALQVSRDVSLTLPRGCRYALIGPNGAGKTTLINLITGQLKPDSGTIELDGQDITAASAAARVRKGLARTFQINTLFPELTPIEAVTLAVSEREALAGQFWRRVSTQTEAIDEAFEILSRLRLAEVATQPTRILAYGQQRLLEIALALATRPKVL
ncbi:MAG: ABC transporter ATP-binding protein, partial [Aliihoeflea sp.]